MAGGSETAQALWYVGPGRAEIRTERLPPLADGQVRVRALYGAISRGTEALIAAGRVPESEYQRMRAPFMAGDFPFPVKYGYATVGRGRGRAGRCWSAARSSRSIRTRPCSTCRPKPRFRCPQEIPPSRAVLAANMETALNATWDAAPGPSGRIAVVGAGVVGALVGSALRADRGRRGDAGRYRSGAGEACADARLEFRHARKRAERLRFRLPLPAPAPPGLRPRSTSRATRRPSWS